LGNKRVRDELVAFRRRALKKTPTAPRNPSSFSPGERSLITAHSSRLQCLSISPSLSPYAGAYDLNIEGKLETCFKRLQASDPYSTGVGEVAEATNSRRYRKRNITPRTDFQLKVYFSRFASSILNHQLNESDVSVSRLWNSLPENVRGCRTLSKFKASLKQFIFKETRKRYKLKRVAVCVQTMANIFKRHVHIVYVLAITVVVTGFRANEELIRGQSGSIVDLIVSPIINIESIKIVIVSDITFRLAETAFFNAMYVVDCLASL
ncbi:hypothetical protein C0J52_26064, partial [Blattella germanica]